MSWRNLDTGATGEHRLVQNLPGNWPSHGDDQNNTSLTGPGPIEYRLVTNGGGAHMIARRAPADERSMTTTKRAGTGH